MKETEAERVKKPISALKIVLIVLCALGVAALAAFLLNRYAFSLITISGTGMEPTVEAGDKWLIDKSFDGINRGDVVTFKKGGEGGASLSRVVAVGGDSLYLDLQTGRLYINGDAYDEPYAKISPGIGGSYISKLADSGYGKENPLIIEEGYIFVMGDNRGNSRDSREFGPISEEDVFGILAKKFK